MTCRFIQGPLGSYCCGCRDPAYCHKSPNALQLRLTPRCFTYSDRFVQQGVGA